MYFKVFYKFSPEGNIHTNRVRADNPLEARKATIKSVEGLIIITKTKRCL